MTSILYKLKKYAELLPEFNQITVQPERDGFELTSLERIQWSFPNGYGASLSCNIYSYGGAPEFAVTRNGSLCYSTDITSDVIPCVTVPEVATYLARIRGF
jgi:hypothetical protein